MKERINMNTIPETLPLEGRHELPENEQRWFATKDLKVLLEKTQLVCRLIFNPASYAKDFHPDTKIPVGTGSGFLVGCLKVGSHPYFLKKLV